MTSHTATSTTRHGPAHTDKSHPGPWVYIRIAVILAVVTAIEVVLFYLGLPDAALTSTLFFLSIIKFALVVLYFMHLRFDARIFRRLFMVGLILAPVVYAIVLTTFGLFR
jgi:cytochrome c oxidase subunit 4